MRAPSGLRRSWVLVLLFAVFARVSASEVDSVEVVQAGGNYITGESLTLRVTFSPHVDIDITGGVPSISLNTGASATYAGGTANNQSTLDFTYTIAGGESTASLATTGTPLITLNGGAITKNSGGAADLSFPPGVILSQTASGVIKVNHRETISAIEVTDAGGNRTVGQSVALRVTMSGDVVVTGVPNLALNSGGTATFSGIAGVPSSQLTFTYPIGASDRTTGLKVFDATPFELPSGASVVNADRAAINANLAFSGSTSILLSTVNAQPTTILYPETITSLAVVQPGGGYVTNDVLDLRVTFSGPVDVVTTSGTPSIALNTTGSTGVATYVSGTGSNQLIFRYTVLPGQASIGLGYGVNALSLNSGTITNTNNSSVSADVALAAGTLLSAVDNNPIIITSPAPATITGVTVSQADGNYTAGQAVNVVVTFSGAVDVTGTPTLALNSGTTLASYFSGAGTAALTFTYLIGASDITTLLDYASTTPIALPGGATITNTGTTIAVDRTCATPGLAGSISDNQSLSVNVAPRTITDIAIAEVGGNYLTGQTLNVQVTFSGVVVVTGTPTIALTSGGTASYTSGSNSAVLTFAYTILAAHTTTALDHTQNPSIALAGGTIRNSNAVVDADRTFAPSGALLGSDSQPFSINRSPRAFLGGGSVADIPPGMLTYPPPAAPLETVLSASGVVSPSATRIQSLSVTLLDRPDGSAESIALASGTILTNTPFSLVTVGSFNNLTGTLTITTSSGNPTGSDYTVILQKLVYKHANQASATPGNRRVIFTVTDTDSRSGVVSTANLTVASGLPVVSLSGITTTPDTTLLYTDSSGPASFSTSATVSNPTPIWQPTYQNFPYDPYDLYPTIGTNNLSYYVGSVLDQIIITLTNPDASGLFPDDGTETISVTLPNEYTFSGGGGGAPGHFLGYDGNFPYPMYSIQNPDAVFTVVGALTTTQTKTLAGGQTGAQLTVPILSNKFPIPTAMVETILRSLRYTNTSINPSKFGTRRTISVAVTNSSTGPTKTSVPSVCEVTIVPINNQPVVSGPVSYSVAEADPLNSSVLSLNGLTINDIDGNGFAERLTLSVANGTLHIAISTGLTVSGNGTATLVLEGALDGSTGALSDALATGNLTYRPTDFFNGTDTLTINLNDLGHASAGNAFPLIGTRAIPITVTAINQPPSLVVPSTRTVAESIDLVLTGVALADPDVGTGQVQVTLSAGNGTLILAQTTNLVAVFSDVEGSGVPGSLASLADANQTMTFRGTLTDIGNALTTLVYRAGTGFYGDHDTITVAVNDLGGNGTRNLGNVVPSGVAPSSVSGSQAWIATSTIDVVVRFANAAPVLQPSTVNPLTENRGVSVPVNASIVLRGGTGTLPTYPLLNQPRNTTYSSPVPSNAGTAVLSDSNLVAWDEETKDPRGLTYVINLGVSQGRLLRQRPSDPPTGISIVAIPVAADQSNSFTQDDLNHGYISYTHNGTLSGDDGFVFTVRDDNPWSRPAAYGVPPTTDASQGESAPVVFNIGIDRTLPQVILSSSTPVFYEPVPSAMAVPVLVDAGLQMLNTSDTNVPRQFAPAGSSGASITATINIPSSTRVAVHPAPALQGGDDLDELSIQDSGSVHVGPFDPLTGITPLVYGSSFSSGTQIGSFTGGRNGVPLVISLASPSPLLVSTVEDLLRHLTFSNTSNNPSASPRSITIQAVNGSATSSIAVSKTVNVVPYNQAPTLSSVRRILAVPKVAVPFGITRGTATDPTVATIDDPDGEVTYTISPQPIKGTVSATSTPGVFTYTAAVPNPSVTGILTDEFTIIATDNGLVSDGVTPLRKSSSPLVIEIVITDINAIAPVIESNPPVEANQGSLLSYTPQVRSYSIGQLGVAPQLSFTLINPGQATTPALGFSTSDGTITWSSGWSLPASTGLEPGVVYQRLGILVNDLANETAAYQSIMLRVVQPPTGSN